MNSQKLENASLSTIFVYVKFKSILVQLLLMDYYGTALTSNFLDVQARILE